jgi:DNA-binding transcriptional ArsR family regulator
LAKRGPDLIDPRLVKALEHPTRVEILNILWEGPSSPARIQRRLEHVSLNLVSHHMKVLKKLGCVELVETVSRRGAKERIYRTVGPFIISDEVWNELTPKMRQPVTAAILRMISNDLARSLGAGKFDAIVDNHLSRTPLQLDREGWSEVARILERATDELVEAGEKSQQRLEAGDETPVPAMVAIMHFPMAEGE